MRLYAIAVWLAVPLLAQATPTEQSTSLVASIAQLIVQLGISGVFLWWALQERKERQAVQRQRDAERAEEIPLITRAVEVMQQVQTGMGATVERVTPERRDLDALLGRLARVIDAMEDRGG